MTLQDFSKYPQDVTLRQLRKYLIIKHKFDSYISSGAPKMEAYEFCAIDFDLSTDRIMQIIKKLKSPLV